MKVQAVIEVIAVFGLTLLLIAVVSVSPIGAWERRLTDRYFLEYALMIAVPLLVLFVCRRSPADYGISSHNLKYQLDIAMTGLVPVAIASLPFAFIDHLRWGGAFVMAAVRIALLFALALLLRKKPTFNAGGARADGVNAGGAAAGLGIIWFASGSTATAHATGALSALVFYIFFLGLGEELLFRGYIQSRLNVAWGRPFRFHGVRWGWGLFITAALFGCMHVLNLGGLSGGSWRPAWAWGFWTFFGGLVFGFVREKTGSIVAPALLHGLPQAIAYAIMGL